MPQVLVGDILRALFAGCTFSDSTYLLCEEREC